MNNLELKHSIKKIQDMKKEQKFLSVTKNYDDQLDQPFIINIEDLAFFYALNNERNEDFIDLLALIKQ